jgi:hypothetical protein
MTRDLARHPRLEQLLAGVLHYGTWAATAVIAAGLVLTLIGQAQLPPMTGAHVVAAGIALFILLPVLRVLLMLIVFVGDGDYRFAAIAALVLAIITASVALGLHSAARLAG